MTIAGHRTSVALEREFWAALDAMAASRGVPCSVLVGQIDSRRGTRGLASALRVAVLFDLNPPRR